jgi:hypothetical protein
VERVHDMFRSFSPDLCSKCRFSIR